MREDSGVSQVKVLQAQEEKSEIEARSLWLKMVFLIIAEETNWSLVQAEGLSQVSAGFGIIKWWVQAM